MAGEWNEENWFDLADYADVDMDAGVLEPILRKDCLIRGSPRLKSRREIDTEIFIQVQAFSGENNNPTPVCV